MAQITYEGLEELRARFAQFPQKYEAGVNKALEASLLAIHEQVRPYPPQRKNSWYKRTGLLGRSLGVSADSGKGGGGGGKADIEKVYKPGQNLEAVFGTNIYYAPRVIGDLGRQEYPWNKYWWRIDQVAESATPKVIEIFTGLAEKLARFLDGQAV